MTKSRHLITQRKKWSPEEQELLKQYYADQTSADLVKAFGCTLSQIYQQAWRLGLQKSKEFIAAKARENTMRPNHGGALCRFQPGHVPANKGMKGFCAPGSEKGQFKKGQKPPNHQEVGALRINAGGYLDIKLEEGLRGWYSLGMYSWFLAHGSFPAPGLCLRFKDGDVHNTDPDNLSLITRRENMLLNTIHRYPKDLRSAMILGGKLRNRIKKLQEAQHV